MEATITTVDAARSLWIIYRQMSVDVQQEFMRLIEEEEDHTGWMRLTEEALSEDWNAPENDIWDEFHARQHG